MHLHCLSSFKTRVVLELNTKNVSVTFANRELYSNIWRPAIAFVSVKNVFVFFLEIVSMKEAALLFNGGASFVSGYGVRSMGGGIDFDGRGGAHRI